jgi:hypothetical protein
LDLAELLKWCLVVLGQGVWFAIQLVPLCILYLIFSILSLAGMIITETIEKIQSAFHYTTDRTALAFQWMYVFATDFPVEAILGLITGIAIACWSHKNRVFIRNFGTRLGWKISRAVRLGIG